jgi:hypothetical protein
MKDMDKGLYSKYIVMKADDAVEMNETGLYQGHQIEGECFVLRPDRDPAAMAAMREYAEETTNLQLAADIYEWLAGIEAPNA